MFVYLQPQSLPLGLQKRAVGQQKSIRKRPKNDLQRVSRDCSNFEFSDSVDWKSTMLLHSKSQGGKIMF